MSEVSSDRELGPCRDLRDDELTVLKKMISGTVLEARFYDQIAKMKVQDMPDGGMGSIRFYKGRPRSALAYGDEVAEAAFQDGDGVPVSVTLSVDRAGDLFELDVFKADGSPLVRYPDADDLSMIRRDERGNVVSAL